MLPIFAKAHPDFKLATARVPAGPGGSISVVGGEDIVLTQTSKNKVAALKFLRFMISPWAQTQMARAGQLPVRKDVTKNLLKINPGYGIFLKQLETAKPRTPHPNWPKIDEALGAAVAERDQGRQDDAKPLSTTPRARSTPCCGASKPTGCSTDPCPRNSCRAAPTPFSGVA